MDITVMVSWLSGAQVPFTSEYNHYINFLLSSCYWPLLFEFVWIGWCLAWTNKRLHYDYRLRPAMWLSNAQLLNQEAFISQSAAQREGRNVSHNLQLPIPTDCNSAAISQFVHWTHKKDKGFPFGTTWGNYTWAKALCRWNFNSRRFICISLTLAMARLDSPWTH